MQEKMPDLVSWLEYNEIVRKMFGNEEKGFQFYNSYAKEKGFSVRRISAAKIAVYCSIVWNVMELCYKILGEGKLVHQRELFYKLLSDSPKYFSYQRHVNQAIQGG